MDGAKVTTNNPLVIAALETLIAAAPGVLSFEELKRAATARLASGQVASAPSDDDSTLCAALLSSARGGLVEFRVLPWKWPVAPSALPKASALARWEALRSNEVTTLMHSRHTLSGIERFLLEHLDGTKDRGQLARLIEHAFAAGEAKLDGFTPTRENVSALLEDALAHLARSALFVA
jgi:hypothetical protein